MLVAVNPDPESRLAYLLRQPLNGAAVSCVRTIVDADVPSYMLMLN